MINIINQSLTNAPNSW